MGQSGLRWKLEATVTIALAALGVLGVFALDLLTPLGYAVWVGYGLPLWALSRFPTKTTFLVLATTLACTGLIAAGYVLSPPGMPPVMALVNRTIGVCFLWVMTGVLLRTRANDERFRATQEHLQQSEARYRELVQALPAAVYTCDERGRITLYNQAAVALWGREPEVGKDLWCGSWKIYRPDGAPLPLDECPMAVTLREGQATHDEEIVIERPDGTRRHVLPHPEPMRNATGTVVGAVNMLVDITDRKQAEHAAAHLAAIVTSSADAIISKDLQGMVRSWNRAAERLFGYTAEEMIGQPVSLLIPPDRKDEEPAILKQIERGETIEQYETIRRRKDGTDLQISLTVSPLIDSHGRVIGASKIARNITEQKRIEAALRRSERDLSDFFDNASVGLHWVGPDGIITRVNQTELDLLGYSREEYVGRHIGEFHADQPVIQDILSRLAGGETLREYPARIRCKDGSILDGLINSNTLFEEGKFIHTRCFTRDVTNRKRADEALRESEERFHTLADNMSQFAWTADPTGWVFWYNQRWYAYTGTTFEEMQGWGWEKVHHPDHLNRVVTKWRHAHITGEPWEDTFPLRGLDGTYRWFLSRALPIRDAEGRIIRWFGTNTDITELREAQASLLISQERIKKQAAALAEANKELVSFSYSVSHDLRAPLRTIDAFSRIVEEDHGAHLNAEASRCLTIVRKAVGYAGELIDDLLEFSRLGRQDMTFSAVTMEQLARETADDLMTMQGDRQIHLTVGNLPPCQGDPRFLKLVWTNLLTNAFKYTKDRNECSIEVGWMPDDAIAEAVTYYVKDDGVGFDMKYVHKLFNVFQRLHRKEDFEGTGVGLAIVHRIVSRHGGRVWAEGKVDGGATFFFSLRKATA
ncbi:MAG: MEKHLA domain-containing protein [Nitrospira sp. CG24A]|nr:MAG: MEKHLA domain-containing protein [Nitrospira sp. CG24A]